jgi:tRNA-uridine 2-sulfurtransferase
MAFFFSLSISTKIFLFQHCLTQDHHPKYNGSKLIPSMTAQALDPFLSKVPCHIPQGPIVVGMSGGVDSSVSAALLKAKGYEVIGLFMKNWEEEGSCPAETDANDVAQVATIIGIPFYTVSFAKEYWDEVFSRFLEELKEGLTPNPDILCNREVKFKRLLQKSLSIGGTALATGHYASNVKRGSQFFLERAYDDTKDQTYFLYTATQESLSKTLFPLANIPKKDVRRIAQLLGLPVAEKKDSTGICFIGERKFREFLKPYLGTHPGSMVTPEGKAVGSHVGLAYYTIGQRKGIGIGGEGEAWFVAGKDVEKNRLIVVQGADHPALFANGLTARQAHWISGKSPLFPCRCTAKIRYRQPDQMCTVASNEDGSLSVSFDTPQRAITPQQSVVFYDGAVCLGGGFIRSAFG